MVGKWSIVERATSGKTQATLAFHYVYIYERLSEMELPKIHVLDLDSLHSPSNALLFCKSLLNSYCSLTTCVFGNSFPVILFSIVLNIVMRGKLQEGMIIGTVNRSFSREITSNIL